MPLTIYLILRSAVRRVSKDARPLCYATFDREAALATARSEAATMLRSRPN